MTATGAAFSPAAANALCWKGCPYRDNGVQPDAD